MELVILVGLQGSGKSSFYRDRFAETHALVSKDLYRSARHPQDRQMREIGKALDEGRPVVVDNTNLTRAARAVLIAAARARDATVVGYFFDARIEHCLLRNAAREGPARVPDVAIHAAARALERQAWDEGFDDLNRVRLTMAGFVIVG